MKKSFVSLLTIFLLLFVLALGASAEEGGPAIRTQPASVTVHWPDGAVFTVEPENPEEVASYQWYYVDSVGNEFELDGVSAKTATLICPTMTRYYDETYFYCVLTGENGMTTASDPACITVENYMEQQKVLYISNYHILAGESLDLSETELGSGVISYASDGASVTFDHVALDNTEVIMDHLIPDAIGVGIDDYNTDAERFDLILIGENSLKNVYYQESSNGSGITLNLAFLGDNTPPVYITGDGSLAITGGTYALMTTGPLVLDAKMDFFRNGDYFNDAIHAGDVVVEENAELTFDVNGTVIFSENDIVIKNGASIDAKTSIPHVGGENTHKYGFLCGGNASIEGADVKMELTSDPERFLPWGLAIDNFLGMEVYGDLSIRDSCVAITQTALPAESLYFRNGGGISCEALTIENSNVSVNVDSPEIASSNGIITGGDVTITDSTVTCLDHTAGRVFGLAASGSLTIKDSKVTSDAASTDGEAFGMMFMQADIDLSSEEQEVSARVNNGYAFGAKIGEGEEILTFDPAYQPAALTLGEATIITEPGDAVLNQASMQTYAEEEYYIYLETPYSLRDTSEAAKTVVISYEAAAEPEDPDTEETTEPTSEPTSEPETDPKDDDGPKSPATGRRSLASVMLLAALSLGIAVTAEQMKKRK